VPFSSRLRGLYAITPDMADTDLLFAKVQAALAGGCRLLQYRDKISDAPLRQIRAMKIAKLCQNVGATFIVNDDLSLALSVGADGVHLGSDDGDLASARNALGPGKIVGASCYASLECAKSALDAGANYVAFGAVFPSLTKPETTIAPLELLTYRHPTLTRPSYTTCAIGGITLQNASAVIAAGADMLAVITDLFSVPDIAAQAADFQRLFRISTP
jgi:thiamine-phosphate pyrophosphorylase